MTQSKKLIEVAMPVKEISAESVRDKSIRHGHISTLHLWWARRPLPVCRAVVFASLVPDPLDEHCPQAFKDAVKLLLGGSFSLSKGEQKLDWYKPYDDIPYTSAIDRMEDNLRNRLLMFIGKFSDRYAQNEKMGKTTPAKDQLSDASLIKWDNKNNEEIIGKARKLIWVAHNAATGKAAKELLADFDKHYKAIKDAEQDLYSTADRHIETKQVQQKEATLQKAIDAFLDRMPKVFDPFAGGGAIPLEAARLGCRSYGNDINPVAHIIQKGSLEFPQKYGKPITYSKEEFIKLYGKEELNRWCRENRKHADAANLKIEIENRLAFDVEYYAKRILADTEKEIGYLYPADEKGNKPIAYYWARVGNCSNPSCKAKIPLLRQFYLADTSSKKVYLSPVIQGKKISFQVRSGICQETGWVDKGNLKCPICRNTTDSNAIREQFKSGLIEEELLSVMMEGKNGKNYRIPSKAEEKIVSQKEVIVSRSNELLPKAFTGGSVISWGLTKWADLFSNRQYFFLDLVHKKMNLIKEKINFELDYNTALITYLAIFLDRLLPVNTSYGRWAVGRETVTPPFSKQAIPFVFDYPESNPFCDSTGSAANQIDWIIRYIESESQTQFSTYCNNASSGERNQFKEKSLTSVITDPPYYDAIAYADLSDFFYSWLKKSLGDIFPLNFAVPQTPKSDECTALKHHHNDNKEKAKQHFEKKLLQIFDAIEHQTSDIVSIMFAHQSTEAWTTLCNSILGARMNITGSWAIDTEMVNRTLALASSALESSVTVSCKPAQRIGIGEYREVKKSIEKTVEKKVSELYQLGFRGADLLTACFGQAVSEFGKYEKVEKADGSEVTVAELLEMARESAFNALLKGFEGDDFTKFYIGWLQLYGFTESDFDDAAKFTKVGLNIEVQDLFKEKILIKNGNKQTLGGFGERNKNKKLGEQPDSILIDKVHKAMLLFKGTNRNNLLQYISTHAASPDQPFWRVVNSLCEVLPAGSDDHKQAMGLLTNKDSLIRESKAATKAAAAQGGLFE